MIDSDGRPTAEYVRELFHYDPATGHFIRRVTRSGNAKAGMIAGTKAVRGHIQIRMLGNRDYAAHRLAYLYMTGEWPPPGMEIDHINRNSTDNRWCNLRLATSSQNKHNTGRRRHNTSGYKGVTRAGNSRWTAVIRLNRKKHYLGCFRTPEEAHHAYAEAAKRLHGDFARSA